MPDKRHWSSALAAGLANLAGRLEDRHTAVTAREAAHHPELVDSEPAADLLPAAPAPPAAPAAADPAPAGQDPQAPAPAAVVPAQRSAPPPMDPVAVVPWSMRVAAEIGWRLLILAGTVWVLMRVIGAVRLVVLSFAAALLITALLQPFVARLKGSACRAGWPPPWSSSAASSSWAWSAGSSSGR